MMAPRIKAWAVMVLTLAFLALLITDVARETPCHGMRRTEPIRRNLHRLQSILFTVERWLGALPDAGESEQKDLMHNTVGILKDYLLPHLAAEEAVLHPAVDRRQPEVMLAPTQVLKQEHDVMRRWIKELETLADAPLPDHKAFACRGERLLGLIEAHFELDESLLFPILDQESPWTRGRE
jgi:iron-sulfur cluster repair protein YtfE (RIC family)